MTVRPTVFGMAMAAALLLGYQATATATPMATPRLAGVSAFSGDVTQAVLGSERRQARRYERQTHREARREERQMHREARRGERYAHRVERRSIRQGNY